MKFCAGLPHMMEIPGFACPWELEQGGREIKQMAVLIEELGYDSTIIPEHFVMPREHWELSGKWFLNAAPAQAFVAGATQRIRINTAITLLPAAHPIVTAKGLATLDFLSGGRAAVTFGVGWCKEELEAMGVPFHERGDLSDEYLAAIVSLLRDEEPAFEGKYVSFRDVGFEPRPLQERLPIWIGGEADRALRRAARFADGWMPYLCDPEDLPARIDFIKSQPEYDGRPFEVFVALSTLRLKEGHVPNEDARSEPPRNAAELIDQIGWLQGLGVTEMAISQIGIPSFEAYLDYLRWAAEEVVPKFR